MIISEYSALDTKRFKSLQGSQITVALHCSSLVSLQTSLQRTVGRKGPLSESYVLAVDGNSDSVISDFRSFSVSLSHAKEFLMNLVSFVSMRVSLLDELVVGQLVKDIAKL